jgi:tripartite-type tricarboxylate transporter receptor subunit TctC
MKRLFTIAIVGIAPLPAFADYPDKSITIVVPFAAGGPADKVARDFAEALRKPLGNVAVIVDVD